MFLEQSGDFTVDGCISAREALVRMEKVLYDAIISDYQMPEIDGIAFLKEVRSLFGDIPFIIFTGRGREEVVIEAINSGVDFYVEKGGDPVTLFADLGYKVRGAIRRKEVETALAESRDYLNQIFSSVHGGIVIIDAKTHEIIDVNPAAAEMIGSTKDQIVGKVCHRFMCPSETGRCPITDLHQAVDNSERVLLTADGKRLDIIKYAVPFNLHGRECLLETILDNSERKKAKEDLSAAYEEITASEEELRNNYELLNKKEHELRESEKKYRFLTEVTDDIIYSIDVRGVFTHISPQISRYGYAPEEVISRHFSEFIEKEDLPIAITDLDKTMATMRPVVTQFRIRDSSGNHHWMEDNGAPVLDPSGSVIGVTGVLRDISARRKTEEALRESEEKFRALVENALEGVLIIDFSGSIHFVNDAACRIVNAHDSATPVEGKNILEFIAPEFREEVQNDLNRVASGTDAYLVRYPLTTLTGRKIWVECLGKKIPFGGTMQVLISMRDVTGRKEMEDVLRENEDKYRSLVETSPNMIWEIDLGGKIRYASPKAGEILGLAPEELVGKTIIELSPEQARPYITQELMRTMSSEGSIKPYEIPFHHRDGQEMVIEIRPARITGRDGKLKGFQGVATDITGRKKTEKALRQANRQLNLLSSVTRHDVLNNISIILGFLALTRTEVDNPKLEGYLKEIEAATKAIRSQIEFTRVYQDLGTHEPQWIPLDEVMPHLQLPPTVTLDTDAGGYRVYADPMFEKVFQNLLDNSLRHGGHVTSIRVSYHKTGKDLVIVWEDNGKGIPVQEKEKIFERGFGNNTGFGLFLIREILMMTDMTIRENGKPGMGARFEITVPQGAYRERVHTGN